MFKNWIPAFAGMTVFMAACFIAPSAFAERRGDQGIGLMIGNPSGFSYKMWLDERIAFDAAAGIDQGEFDMHATFLFHNFNWSKSYTTGFMKDINDNGALPFYFGFGPRALFDHKTEFGIRLPAGLSYLPNDSVWEFFGELAPVIRLTPSSGVDFDYAIGLRYYFPAVRPRAE